MVRARRAQGPLTRSGAAASQPPPVQQIPARARTKAARSLVRQNRRWLWEQEQAQPGQEESEDGEQGRRGLGQDGNKGER